jgi:hypothetical protein
MSQRREGGQRGGTVLPYIYTKYISVCVCVCVCVCKLYLYSIQRDGVRKAAGTKYFNIYIYIYTHTHTHTNIIYIYYVCKCIQGDGVREAAGAGRSLLALLVQKLTEFIWIQGDGVREAAGAGRGDDENKHAD